MDRAIGLYQRQKAQVYSGRVQKRLVTVIHPTTQGRMPQFHKHAYELDFNTV